MAQTKRKRRTKHRGTAAGTIETRGRTGRPPTPEEKKKAARMTARERRLNTPPTWKGSFTRATMAAAILFIFVIITQPKGSNRLAAALIFALLALAIYVPAGYYLEVLLYRRRQRKKELSGTGPGGDGGAKR
jgi:Flp pilus assembly protein TadB